MTRENKDFINRLNLRFGEIDKRTENFIYKFEVAVKPMVLYEFPAIKNNDSLTMSINDYAVEMFSFTQSTIDKDKEYSEFKKDEELKSMTSLVARLSKNFNETDFSLLLHNKAKSLTVDEFPDIYELSSQGFLILEKYTKLKNMAFMTILNRLVKEK